MRAGEVPLGVARDCASALDLALEMASIGNVNAISDAGVAGELALAGLKAAALNVRINAAGLTNAQLAERWKAELPTLQQVAEASLHRLQAALAERAGL
jgi:glutamate formiminotransferase/formiminotetrahydrofolate cyclodeaminase